MNQTILTALELAPGIGAFAWAIYNYVTTTSTATTAFDRTQIVNLNKRVGELETKIDNQQKEYERRLSLKDEVIAKKDKEIDGLKQQLTDMGFEISELRHRLNNVEQTTAVKKDLLDKQS